MVVQEIPRWLKIAVVAVAILLVYGGSFTLRRTNDTHVNSLQTRALVLHGDVDLTRYGPQSGIKIERDGHLYSIYGVGISLLSAPVYASLVRLGASERVLHAGGVIPPLVAAGVMLLFLMRRISTPAIAVGTMVLFLFGTTLWPTASTALWQHAIVAFLQVATIAALLARKGGKPVLAGLALGTVIFVRQPAAVAMLPVAIYMMTRGRRFAMRSIAGLLIPLTGLLVENLWLWGRPAGAGYLETQYGFGGNIGEGLIGQLFAPWRGIFVYSPALALGIIGVVIAVPRIRHHQDRLMAALGIGAVLTIGVYASWEAWWGGAGQYGYRLLLDTVPWMVILSGYALTRLPRLRPVGAVLIVASVANMVVGTLPDRLGWAVTEFPQRLGDTPIARAWSAAAGDPLEIVWRLALVAVAAAAAGMAVGWWSRSASDSPATPERPA